MTLGSPGLNAPGVRSRSATTYPPGSADLCSIPGNGLKPGVRSVSYTHLIRHVLSKCFACLLFEEAHEMARIREIEIIRHFTEMCIRDRP